MSNFLIADALKHDPRIAAAKKMMVEAVRDHQKKITKVKPSDPTLKLSYQDTLAQFAKIRGHKLWYPYLGSGIGHGPLVELLDGSIKYDCINGIGVHMFGHSYPALIEASLDASLSNTIMQGNLQQNQDSMELMQLLTKISKKDHCFLTTSGVMANENAIKIAFQNKSPAHRILAFDHCFAGRTWAFSQVTDKPIGRKGLPQNVFVDYVPFYDPKHPKESTNRALETLEMHLMRYPDQHAVMIFELVQGEGGINVGTKAFFETIMQRLKDHNILIWADEVQSFGRTQKLFSFQYFELERYIDIITIGKLAHVCATLYNESLNPLPGLLSQTFTSSTSMIRASKTIIEHLIGGDYYGSKGKIAALEHHFIQRMGSLVESYPKALANPSGIGTMLAFTPFEGEFKKVTDFSHKLFDAGVISFVTGQAPTKIRFLLSVTTTLHDLDHIIDIVETTLKKQL